MGLPPRVFFTIQEAAARWGCTPADIAGWASTGQLRIVTGIEPVQAGREVVGGLVEISTADILTMFRRCGSGPLECRLRRVRSLEAGADGSWAYITEPADGVLVAMPDLLLLASDVSAFEEEHEIFGRPRASAAPNFKYDWDAFWQHLAVRIFREGLPETQDELVNEMQEFFIRRSESGEAPDGRTLRRRITPIWRELRDQAS